jgi:hypothetical protein
VPDRAKMRPSSRPVLRSRTSCEMSRAVTAAAAAGGGRGMGVASRLALEFGSGGGAALLAFSSRSFSALACSRCRSAKALISLVDIVKRVVFLGDTTVSGLLLLIPAPAPAPAPAGEEKDGRGEATEAEI